MFHTLLRGDTELLTDADTWLCVLDIATFIAFLLIGNL